jgi:predicted nucleotidyltransferase
MSLIEVVQSKRTEIERLAAKHGAANVRIFGSVLRGQETSGSDIDFLIDVVSRTSAWFPSGLALDLEDLLGRPVDVVTERSLHPALRERVLQEARPL